MEKSAILVRDMLAAAANQVVSIAADSHLVDAARLLVTGTDILIVCNREGILQGVVTKTDIVRQMSLRERAACDGQIATVMTCDVILCRDTDLLYDVSIRMKERHVKNIPVVDGNNRPIAVLAARAVLRVLLGDAEYLEAQLIDYVEGVGYR